jgi:hypothetical protein
VACVEGDVRSTKPTNLPVRPPTLLSALAAPLAALAAPARAGPAAEVTRDRPWAALDWTSWAVSLVALAAFLACAEAASVVWKRRAAKRRFCLRRGRAATAADDIVVVAEGVELWGLVCCGPVRVVRSGEQSIGRRRSGRPPGGRGWEGSALSWGVDWLLEASRRVEAVAKEGCSLVGWKQGWARCVLRKFQWSSEQNGLLALANQEPTIRSYSGSRCLRKQPPGTYPLRPWGEREEGFVDIECPPI